MSQNNPPSSPNVPGDAANQPGQAQPAPRKKRRGWWWKIPLVLLVLLLLLVLLAPTIASTATVRDAIVSQVNGSINGHMQIADWSLGWTSPTRISGLQIYDQNNALMLEIPKLQTKLSLLDLIRGNYDLGDTVIDLNLARLSIDREGKTNLQKLAKNPSQSTEPISLPNIHGKVTVNLRGTVDGEAVPEPVYIDPSTVVLNIPDINAPVDDSVKLVYRMGSAANSTAVSSLSLAGNIHAVHDNKLQVDPQKLMQGLSADQKLELANVDLAAVAPFLKGSDPNAQLAGIANGGMQVALGGADRLSANGQITVANFAFGGDALKGGVFKTSQLSLPVSISQQTIGNVTVLKIDRLGVVFDQGQIAVSGSVPQQALANLKANQPPGHPGELKVSVQVPQLARLANDLPQLFALQQGVQLTGGSFTDETTIAFTQSNVTIRSPYSLRDLAATKGGSPVGPLQPIEGTVEATVIPTGATAGTGGKAVPDVRDVVLRLKSAFANIEGGGQSLAGLQVRGDYDLRALRENFGQLFDLSMFQDGRGQFTLNTQGELAGGGPIAVRFTLNGTNLALNLPNASAPPAPTGAGAGGGGGAAAAVPVVLNEPWVSLACSAQVDRDANQTVQAVRDVDVKFQTGSQQTPTIDAHLTAAAQFKAVPAQGGAAGQPTTQATLAQANFAAERLFVNLPAVQKEFAPFFASLTDQQIRLANGTINLTMAGSYDGSTLVLSPQAPLRVVGGNLTIQKAGRTVLENQPLEVTAAGTVKMPQNAAEVALSSFVVKVGQGLLTLQKAGNGDLVLRKLPDGKVQPNANLELAADLYQLNALAQAFIGKQVVVQGQKPAPGELTSGLLNGTISYAPSAQQAFNDLSANLTISNLSVTTYQQPIANEQVTVVLKGQLKEDLSGLNATADVNSSFATTQIRDLQVAMPKAGAQMSVLDMLPKAHVETTILDLPKAQAILNAFTPPAPPQAQPVAAAPAEAPVSGSQVISHDPGQEVISRPVAAGASAPLSFTSGSAKLLLDLVRQGQTTTITHQLAVSDLSFQRGQGSYSSPKGHPSTLNLTAAIETNPAAANAASVTDQIQKLTVSQLDGAFDFGTLKMTQPIVLADIPGLLRSLSTTQPAGGAGAPLNLTGSFKVDGHLANATTMLAALQGKPAAEALPVLGDFTATPTISAQGTAVRLAAPVTLTKFQVMERTQGGEQKVAFAEDQLAINTDVTYDTAAKNVTFNNVGVNTQSSQALQVAVTGQILGLGAQQQFKDVQIRMTPDLAKVWAILLPMLSPEQQKAVADLQVAGKQESGFAINGRFPADQPFTTAIQQLDVQGNLGVAQVNWPSKGLALANLTLPVVLQKGVLAISNPQGQQGSAGAELNGGKLNLGGIALDLRYEMPHLSVPSNQAILAKVQTNKLFANAFLSGINPLFLNPKELAGTFDLTCVECRDLPLSWLVPGELHNSPGRVAGQTAGGGAPAAAGTAAGGRSGRGEFTFSMVPITIDNMIIDGLRKVGGRSGPIAGSITNGKIVIENGQVFTYVPLAVENSTLVLDGSVRLADRYIDHMDMAIPKAFVSDTILGSIPLPFITKNLPEIRRALPDVIHAPIEGPIDNPKFDFAQAVAKSVASSLKGGNLLNTLPGLLGGQKPGQNPAAPQQQNPAAPQQPQQSPPSQQQQQQQNNAKPAQPTPEDIVGGLLQGLTQPKKKDKKNDGK